MTSLKLPDPAPAWQGQLDAVLAERHARMREQQAASDGLDDHELARVRGRVADWLNTIGQPVLRELENRLTRSGSGWRVAGNVDHERGRLSVAITQGGAAVLDYALTLAPEPEGGILPRAEVRRHGGRPEPRAFRARLDGETDLDGIIEDDVLADITAALAEVVAAE